MLQTPLALCEDLWAVSQLGTLLFTCGHTVPYSVSDGTQTQTQRVKPLGIVSLACTARWGYVLLIQHV